jgi:hypothetical protein
MKHSNLVLGIGILVAVLLIAGSIFLKADPLEGSSPTSTEQPISKVTKTMKNMATKPLQELSKKIMPIR